MNKVQKNALSKEKRSNRICGVLFASQSVAISKIIYFMKA
jgi:hypothetical protein